MRRVGMRSSRRTSMRAQHAGGDIEQTLAELEALLRKVEQRGGFRVQLEHRAAIPMDPCRDAVIPVAAVFFLHAPRFLRGHFAECQRAWRSSQAGALAGPAIAVKLTQGDSPASSTINPHRAPGASLRGRPAARRGSIL